MSYVFEHRIFAPTFDSPNELAATTRTLLARWSVPTRPAARLIARVRTLATLLTACEAGEFHLHLLHEDGQVRAQITAPTGALSHHLPAWQAHPTHPQTHYTTGVDTQDQPLDGGAPHALNPQHVLAPQERKSA